MVIRVEKNKNYSVISNYHLRDKRITLKAKGLLSLMLSLPNDWEYSISGLCKICKEQETSITSTIEELQKFNYLIRNKIPPHDNVRTFTYEYIVYEKPLDSDCLDLENLALENQGQINIEEENKEKQKKELDKQKAKEKLEKKKAQFEEWWVNYPRKVNKGDARTTFCNLTDEEIRQAFSGLEKQLPYLKDKPQQYIPHATTWLNGKRWEDDVEALKENKNNYNNFRDKKSKATPSWVENYKKDLETKEQQRKEQQQFTEQELKEIKELFS